LPLNGEMWKLNARPQTFSKKKVNRDRNSMEGLGTNPRKGGKDISGKRALYKVAKSNSSIGKQQINGVHELAWGRAGAGAFRIGEMGAPGY